MVAIRVWIPGDAGTWVELGDAAELRFERVPCIGEFIGHHGVLTRYQVKLVTQMAPPGAVSAIIHAVPVNWEEVSMKAHPSTQSWSTAGQ